jgi:hypothetical protein
METFAAIYRLGSQTYGGIAARRTGVQAAGVKRQMYVEYAGCANQRPTGIESGNPFPGSSYARLFAVQLHSFQIVLKRLTLF